MIATVQEFEGSFWLNLKAETIQDAAFIARAGINGIKKVSVSSDVYTDGKFCMSVRVRSRRHKTSSLRGNIK